MPTPTEPARKVAPAVHQGPIEGVQIVDGRPHMESVDMPSVSFEWIEKLARQKSDKQRLEWTASQVTKQEIDG